MGKKQQKECGGHWNHTPMKFIVKYLEYLGIDPKEYTYFTIIRDPINRLISNFKYCKFDKDWHAFYSVENHNALMDFTKDYDFKYYGTHSYTINDYISIGLEKSSNLCTHPMPIIDYTEILDKDFKIFIFKLECLDELENFLSSYSINFKNVKLNKGRYDSEKIRDSITKENINKVYNIYKYEYTHFYTPPLIDYDQ